MSLKAEDRLAPRIILSRYVLFKTLRLLIRSKLVKIHPSAWRTLKSPGNRHLMNADKGVRVFVGRVPTCTSGGWATVMTVSQIHLTTKQGVRGQEIKWTALHRSTPTICFHTAPTPRRTTHIPFLVRLGDGTPLRRERIHFTSGRALRSSSQHCSTVSHSVSVNPRCIGIAFSGLFGRRPSKIASMIAGSR